MGAARDPVLPASGSGFRFDRLAPVSPKYASMPVGAAFNWSACATLDASGEWYLVAFRSLLREDADEERLRAFDDRAFEEATSAPGFVHYFKGPTNEQRECLSFCLWDSRMLARAAAGHRAHAEAVAIAHSTYERYTLEFLRVRKRRGSLSFDFEPYDRPHREASAA
jgi:heme-degrading monooxygenase HmoA